MKLGMSFVTTAKLSYMKVGFFSKPESIKWFRCLVISCLKLIRFDQNVTKYMNASDEIEVFGYTSVC